MSKLSQKSERKILSLYKRNYSRQEIKNITGHCLETIRRTLSKFRCLETRRYRKHKVNEMFFTSWSYDMAYVLGFTATDGSVDSHTLSFNLSIKDKEIISYLQNKIGGSTEFRNKNKAIRLRINSTHIIKQLNRFGIVPNKTFSIRANYPIPKKYIGDFIRGVIDGDGWVWRRKYGITCGIVSASENFIKDIQNLLGGMGKIRCRDYSNKPNRSKQYYLEIHNTKDIIKLRKKLYSSDSFGLKRKKDKFLSL